MIGSALVAPPGYRSLSVRPNRLPDSHSPSLGCVTRLASRVDSMSLTVIPSPFLQVYFANRSYRLFKMI